MPLLISSDKIKARHFHSTKRFIDDLCALNDGGELGRSICDIFLMKLELHGDHATMGSCYILNWDITIKERTFIYKLFDKRDSFPFPIARMPHTESNIPNNIFYSAIKGEFSRIVRSAVCLRDFVSKVKERMK